MPVPLRTDFDATQVRGMARKNAAQTRRLLTLAATYDDTFVRDWVANSMLKVRTD